ncbi:MAG: alanine--tRNA ligase [Acidimicrobiia bacterium]|nr:alanine--tRNA ligase [Acidimicrobiia bacterium]
MSHVMETAQIRRNFIDFFAARGHEIVPSSSLIPVDPTLLLTNAGMVQFKPYMVGDEVAPWPRAVSVQKCARAGGKHNDLEQVGRTARHLTFFEMLGNFSFGDYFKEKAIPWAWELVTEAWGVDPELLWVTVHETDDEAVQIWHDTVGLPASRLQRFDSDNWWTMGVAGPCGPSSEIFFDKGRDFGVDGGPAADEARYVEIWNLVFMQYLMDDSGAVLGELPQRNIDTGAGLERVSATLNRLDSVFDIDTIRPVIAAAESASGVSYGNDGRSDVSLRILGDHARSSTFLVTDGVFPSNEERGFVLRKIIRRAVRHAWLLDIEETIMPRLATQVAEHLGDAYPEVGRSLDTTREILGNEEERFRATLRAGMQLIESELDAVEGEVLSGAVAFRLHDTFGFPIEVTKEVAAERGLRIDESEFEAEMAAQRQRAKEAARDGAAPDASALETFRSIATEGASTRFVGYEGTRAHARIIALVAGDVRVDSAPAGAQIDVFTDVTPFYAEAGGQVGDTGTIEAGDTALEVEDTQYALPGLVRHRCTVREGVVRVGADVELCVDAERRAGVRRHHTATHLLHWALRETLGDHVRQHGSLVEPDRLRFDFSHFAAVTPAELAEVERLANREMLTNEAVLNYETSKTEADEAGVIAFFGDKYGDTVRVLEAGSHSRELCGGTHVSSLGEIGPIVITSESSIGSNLRRIEALAGAPAFEYLQQRRLLLAEAAEALHTRPREVPAQIERRLGELQEARKQVEALSARLAAGEVTDLLEDAFDIGGDRDGATRAVVMRIESVAGPKDLQRLATEVRGRLGSGVAVLGADFAGKASLVAAVSKDLQDRGLSAADIVRPAAVVVGGGTGNNPDVAMAGGPRGSEIDHALSAARDALAGWQPNGSG